ncbi:MAG: SpoIIIAH-like protein [Firmicutes bacterium]|nr:SpoIIIAH-like protein [Bacillota bacterium]
MLILKIKKPNSLVFGMVTFVVVVLVVLSLWSYRRENSVAKADRGTAMQVSTTVDMNAQSQLNQDFFVECRLERDRLRSEHSDVLREVIKTAENDELRQKARNDVLKIVVEKERETEMENLIKARGYTDALVLIEDTAVSVVVKTNSLSRENVLEIADIISRVSGAKPEDITISAKE